MAKGKGIKHYYRIIKNLSYYHIILLLSYYHHHHISKDAGIEIIKYSRNRVLLCYN